MLYWGWGNFLCCFFFEFFWGFVFIGIQISYSHYWVSNKQVNLLVGLCLCYLLKLIGLKVVEVRFLKYQAKILNSLQLLLAGWALHCVRKHSSPDSLGNNINIKVLWKQIYISWFYCHLTHFLLFTIFHSLLSLFFIFTVKDNGVWS